MHLTYSDSDEAYRREVRAFLEDAWSALDPALRRDREAVARFRRDAVARGYLYRAIPRRYGGSEQPYDLLKAEIIREEFGRARAPAEVSGNGMAMLVPTLLELGTDWQLERFVPGTVSGEYVWAQGYSEPGAGSDLASLQTRGELVGGEWRVDGQKIWTTDGHKANYMFALVRTEPRAPRHKGISYLLIDLDQPGVTIRPLKQITGGTEFSEVFLDDVRTPADWIVGGRGEGWAVSKTTLRHERSSIGNASSYAAMYAKLLDLARNTSRDGRPAAEDPVVGTELARIEARVLGQQFSSYRQLVRAADGKDPGLAPMFNKLVCTDIGHRIAALSQELIGDAGLILPGEGDRAARGPEKWVLQQMGSLGVAIAGGSSNIQRNIIAERGFGLPRAAGEPA